MSTAKEEIRRLLDELPDDVSLEELQYHIYVWEKIEAARQAVREERVVSEEEAERRTARWIGAE